MERITRSLARCVVAALVVGGCGSGSQDAKEPAVELVSVESDAHVGQGGAASPEPASPVPEAGGDALVVELGECWFEKPYDFMFGGGATVTVNGKSYSSFTGGINGILYYGDLNSCAAKHTSGKAASYSDNTPFAELSGKDIYSDRMDASQPFGFYNPELVRWGHENLIPDPATLIGGVKAQSIYDVVFSRFFRMMTEAYLWLHDAANLRKETEEYWRIAQDKKQDGLSWLMSRFATALPTYSTGWNGTAMTHEMAIGFWLRRDMDGTAGELWIGLKKVMTTFDAAFFKGLPGTYTSPEIDWKLP